MKPYNQDFFDSIRPGAEISAEIIVPLVLEIINKPKSVVDVGCGDGTWLKVFEKYGVVDIYGLDGEYVDKQALQIPESNFLSVDLEKPISLNRQFDLVVSLEVAEHISEKYAEIFVNTLVNLGPIILFSAAIPMQGGVHHVNEQWPEYWAKRFQIHDYVAIDCLRKRVWENNNVESWYVQNILIFAAKDYLDTNPFLKKEFEMTAQNQLSIVHPRIYLTVSDPMRMPLKKILLALPVAMNRALKIRL